MKSYELMLLFDPGLGEEKIKQVVSKIESKTKTLGGEISKTDHWGTKNLGYSLKNPKKLSQVYYVVIYFNSETSLPAELQKTLKVTEEVFRYAISLAVKHPEKRPAKEEEEIKAVNVGEIKSVEEEEASLGQP